MKSSGLRSQASHSLELKSFQTKVFDLGPCLLEDLDDVAKVLAIVEGEGFKELPEQLHGPVEASASAARRA
jgi:hypothetical protein